MCDSSGKRIPLVRFPFHVLLNKCNKKNHSVLWKTLTQNFRGPSQCSSIHPYKQAAGGPSHIPVQGERQAKEPSNMEPMRHNMAVTRSLHVSLHSENPLHKFIRTVLPFQIIIINIYFYKLLKQLSSYASQRLGHRGSKPLCSNQERDDSSLLVL